MKRVLHASYMATMALTLTATTALAQSVSWRQVVGIIPASNTVGVGMGALPGGFLPWTTTDGAARVNLLNGEIRFSVRGLVFAGGAGTPGPITDVKGVLLCDADGSAGGNSVLVETPSVALSSTGDAAFSGNIGSLPAVCSSQVDIAFLIRASVVGGNAVEGPWIANGAVLFRSGNNRDRNDN